MRTLVLFRHAKSSWDQPALDDHARPLAERGLNAAPVMGHVLEAAGIAPDLVVCSTSVRTRQTLDLALPKLGAQPPAILFEDGMYLATASDLLGRVRALPSGAKTAMLVGHNPGFHDLAIQLTGTGDRGDLEALAAKFPTAGVAILTFAMDDWSGVRARAGHLALFATPARLHWA
jgi:phosphohistidine phosphatase